MIKINGVEIPSPTSYVPSIMDLNKADRNARGDMLLERINTKRKLELAWDVIKANELATVLGLVRGTTFSVQYIDPETNGLRTGTFYAGDRSAGALTVENGVVTKYKNFKFNIIER